MRVYPAQRNKLVGQHVVEQLRLVRRRARVGRALSHEHKATTKTIELYCIVFYCTNSDDSHILIQAARSTSAVRRDSTYVTCY